jgi:hypothetical protein
MADVSELLPPPLPPSRPFPWRPFTAVFVPAAALAAGTGLAHIFEGPDASLRWVAFSSVCGLLIGLVAGVALKRKPLWAAYGLVAPAAIVGLVMLAVTAVRPAREWLADRREASCRAEGRAVCSMREFVARCTQAQAAPRASDLLGAQASSSCSGQRCTLKWLYPGPFRPEQTAGPSGLACFVVTDEQGHGVRHWVMAAE